MLSGVKGDSNGLEMLHEEGQLTDPARYSHGVVFFRVFLMVQVLDVLLPPATVSWEFSEWTGLKETDWLTDSRCTSECPVKAS